MVTVVIVVAVVTVVTVVRKVVVVVVVVMVVIMMEVVAMCVSRRVWQVPTSIWTCEGRGRLRAVRAWLVGGLWQGPCGRTRVASAVILPRRSPPPLVPR